MIIKRCLLLVAIASTVFAEEESLSEKDFHDPDLLRVVKAFLSSPPNIEELAVVHNYPSTEEVPSTYYLLRYQGNDMFLKQTQVWSSLDADKDIVGLSAYGKAGNTWWYLPGEKSIRIWNDKGDPEEVNNRVEIACEFAFQEGVRMLLLGLEDMALTRGVIGEFQWSDNNFALFSENKTKDGNPTVQFDGHISEGQEKDTVDLFIRKRSDDHEGNVLEFNYRYELSFDLGWQGDYPKKITRFRHVDQGVEREIDSFETLSIRTSKTPIPMELFKPDSLISEETSVFYLIGQELFEQVSGSWRKMLASDDPRIKDPERKVSENQRFWYYAVAVALILPGIIFLGTQLYKRRA